MSTRKIIAVPAVLIAAALALPSVASADQFSAASEVERLLDEHNSRYQWFVFCQKTGKRKYSCRISGWKGSDHARGRVNVTELGGYRYSVRVTAPLRYED